MADRGKDSVDVASGVEVGEAETPRQRLLARLAEAARRGNSKPGLLTGARLLRELMPGDSGFGDDPLSTAGDGPRELLGRRVSEMQGKKPSVVREASLGALQVWQAVSEGRGRGRGDRELAIAFTDLVAFSDWALDAGDDPALELLRLVGKAIEPPIEAHGGTVVKRLGDGLMAVFDEPAEAIAALQEGNEHLRGVQVDRYTPAMRSGVHLGRPRKLGGDYLGVDVNIASRVAAAAGPSEVLISEAVCERMGGTSGMSRHWRFRAKGTPQGLKVYRVGEDA